MAKRPKILVIDDEEAICLAFRRYFETREFVVETAASAQKGLERWRDFRPDVIFLDVYLPDRDGLELLAELRRHDDDVRIVVITAFGSIDTVIKAVQGRAYDCLSKPIDLDRAYELVRQILAAKAKQVSPVPPATRIDDPPFPEAGLLVGRAPPMQAVYKRIGLVAQGSATVLILGETGTGKELAARAVHEYSARREAPFVAVNCGALPENLVESELFGVAKGAFTGATHDRPGRFEAAEAGTLLLDEVGELPAPAQTKLLRFLDTQTIERLGSVEPVKLDVRVLAATNRDLARQVREGTFREDLYYRLSVVEINLPPLRERQEDITRLVDHFLADMTGVSASPFSEEAMHALLEYDWPGNVRELRNTVEHAVTVSGGDMVLAEHLPEHIRTGQMRSARRGDTETCADPLTRYVARLVEEQPEGHLYQHAVADLEQRLIRTVLEKHSGNHSAAAEDLGIHRNTLRQKLHDE